MQIEKAKGPGYEAIYHREEDVLQELLSDFHAGRPATWPLLDPSMVHKTWEHFSRTGVVREERVLDSIYASMRDNLCRLQLATTAAGHEAIAPESVIGLEGEKLERFVEWLIDTPNGWRISDYGIRPLTDALALAFEARRPATKLKYLDRALHVVHCRSDLSRLFVSGGRETVTALPGMPWRD